MNIALNDRLRPVIRRLRRVRFWRMPGGDRVGRCHRRIVDEVASRTRSSRWCSIGDGVVGDLRCRWDCRRHHCAVELSESSRGRDAVEDRFPSLDQRLLTALSQQDDQLGYLQQRVVKEARDHSRTHPWVEAVPSGKVIWSRLSGLAATTVLAVVLGMLAISARLRFDHRVADQAAAGIKVVPGNTKVERGSSFVVTARFRRQRA